MTERLNNSSGREAQEGTDGGVVELCLNSSPRAHHDSTSSGKPRRFWLEQDQGAWGRSLGELVFPAQVPRSLPELESVM